jgi:uncharacterized protein (DUF305 family)
MSKNRTISIFLALLTVSALSGCVSINVGQAVPDRGGMMSDSSNFSMDDIMFAQMMIPHHQQAVEMSELALIVASDENVKALAEEIASEQETEIDQMKSWLTSAGASEHMGHSMGMNGMVSESDMARLLESKGPEFDKLFLELMIYHH